MKKSRNQRRLVIVIALVGVYFLGKHSSSLGISNNGEEEKRFLRGPFRYRLHSQHQNTEQKEVTSYIVENVERTNANPLLKVNSDSVDTKSPLHKLADTVADLAQDVAIDNSDVENDSLDIHEDHYNEEEQEATDLLTKDNKSLTNKKTAGQEKDLNDKGIDSKTTAKTQSLKYHHTDLKRGKDNQSIKSKPSQVARLQDIKVNNASKRDIKSTNENDKTGDKVVNTIKPKPTVLTYISPSLSKAAPTQSSKGTSNTTTIVNPKEPASSNFAGGIKVQEILKDKLFVIKSKENIEDQFLKVFKTLPYSSLLKQTAVSLPSALNSSFKSIKFGYNKELSDSLPLLRNPPDNRDIRLAAFGIV